MKAIVTYVLVAAAVALVAPSASLSAEPETETNAVFFVRGEVAKPGRFLWTPDMTILKAIATAGGVTDFAPRRVKIMRLKENPTPEDIAKKDEYVIHSYDRRKIEKGEQEDPKILPGDIVVVPRMID